MSYLVFCTFDLKNAGSGDYENAYADLQYLGLSRVHKNSLDGETVIPTTSVMGTYTGTSAQAVRDHIRAKIAEAFKTRRLTSEIFVVVGADGTWGATTT
ncbi:hypothetical protein [Polaromonas sp. CF318]|uniref:hypothetical protein n=1 Tax=Polaromonas sp. CF318 TaxID=1144318 RepID=UPI0009DB2AA6|nr:hypothetical protein [Polaromonas sp. CF318]